MALTELTFYSLLKRNSLGNLTSTREGGRSYLVSLRPIARPEFVRFFVSLVGIAILSLSVVFVFLTSGL